jgi:hypothetical protein
MRKFGVCPILLAEVEASVSNSSSIYTSNDQTRISGDCLPIRTGSLTYRSPCRARQKNGPFVLLRLSSDFTRKCEGMRQDCEACHRAAFLEKGWVWEWERLGV